MVVLIVQSIVMKQNDIIEARKHRPATLYEDIHIYSWVDDYLFHKCRQKNRLQFKKGNILDFLKKLHYWHCALSVSGLKQCMLCRYCFEYSEASL